MGRVARAYASIYFDQEIGIGGSAHGIQFADFFEGGGYEFLSAKSRVDTHQTHQVEVAHDFLYGGEWRMGVEGHSGPHSRLPYGVEGAVQMHASLCMDGQDGCAQSGEVTDVAIRSLDHEVHIQRFLGMASDGLDHRHAKADVGHEHAVHDIDVMPIRLAVLDDFDVATKVSEISGEQRRSDEVCHASKVARLCRMHEYCSMPLSTMVQDRSVKQDPLVVGLTGGIGAGKSVVAGVLRSLGAPVYDADAAAKSLYDRDPALRDEVVATFGSQVLRANGGLDRAALADVVFSSASGLQKLNDLVHPAVRTDFARWADLRRMEGHKVVFREAAILYESGSDADCDQVWAVHAPLPLRMERVRVRSGWSDAQIQARMAQQWTADRVNERADVVITNDGLTPIVPLVFDLLHQL